MNKQELHTAASLASVYGVRMLGLFMILPVFALYAENLPDVTPTLVGIAIGIYGLTQSVFQIPLGLLSDRIGRKPVIILGLSIFALGSVVAALADSIYIIILGRALQGMGAVAAATMALAADLTREDHRAKVMGFIGLSIAFSFSLAMLLGPLMNNWVGVSGIFWFTAVLALSAIMLVIFIVPTPIQTKIHRDAGIVGNFLSSVVKHPQLLRLDAGVFILHLSMTAMFIVLPPMLVDLYNFPENEHWKLYLPAFILSLFMAVPFIFLAEKKHRIKEIMIVMLTALSLVLFAMGMLKENIILLFVIFTLFFVAFNYLEATLPSLIAKYAPADRKGTAMGVFSSAQFMGIFVGGTVGGLIKSQWGNTAVFMFAGGMMLIWLVVTITMEKPRYYSTQLLKLATLDDDTTTRLLAIPGVMEVVVVPENQVAHLKVDKKRLDEARLREFSVSTA